MRVTAIPPVGAAALSVMESVAGLRLAIAEVAVKEEIVGKVGNTISEACKATPFRVAVTVTLAEPLTVPAVTEQEPEVCPAGTVQLEGTGNAVVLLEARATAVPPAGADPLKVRVTVTD